MSTECLGLDAASELDAPSSVKPDTIVQLESPPGIHPSNSTSSDSRLSEYSSGSISTAFTNKTLPISPLRTSLSSPTPPERHLIGRSPVSSGSRASEGLYQDYPRSQGSESLSEKHGSAPYGSSINPPITPTSAGTLRQLHELQLRDQHLRPLRYEPRDTIHQPDPTILEKFELSSNYEDHCQSLSTRDWLRIAVWWQLKVCSYFHSIINTNELKARANLANGERPSLVSPRGSTSPSTKSSNSGHQAYVDLLKASYILYDIVLKRLSPQSLVIDENRKLIADLSDVSLLLRSASWTRLIDNSQSRRIFRSSFLCIFQTPQLSACTTSTFGKQSSRTNLPIVARRTSSVWKMSDTQPLNLRMLVQKMSESFCVRL